MILAAFLSFGVLVVAWLVLPSPTMIEESIAAEATADEGAMAA